MALTPQQKQRKQELTQKLQTRVLNPIEADELKGLLEEEKKEAVSLGDVGKVFGIILLLGLVVAFLSDRD
ncbi:hypothetical protein [Nitrosopumilus sp.]|uniref:hypothetical protein n=1 Tax=Nitrosopumilus sp. TaxID=2024843 RepID=UPI002615B51C|nr:hypothetical protein [Nitrosopumilus sp.]